MMRGVDDHDSLDADTHSLHHDHLDHNFLASIPLTAEQERSIQLAMYPSGALSLIGISYVILHFYWRHVAPCSRQRQRRSVPLDFSSKLVLVLSLFDFATILARMVGRAVVHDPLLCNAQAAVLHASGLGGCLWVCCMAFYLYRWIVGGESDAKRQSRFSLFVAVAVVPSLACVVYHIATHKYGDATFYCWLKDDRFILLHFYLFYALMVVYIVVLHALLRCNMKRRVAWHDTIEADTSSMLIRRKNLLYIVVFIVHRAPMMLYRILCAWEIRSFEFGLFAQVILNLDGLSNSIVYGGLCRWQALADDDDRDDEPLPRGRTFPADSVSLLHESLDDFIKKRARNESSDDLELMLALASMSVLGGAPVATNTTRASTGSLALTNSTRSMRPALFATADDLFLRASINNNVGPTRPSLPSLPLPLPLPTRKHARPLLRRTSAGTSTQRRKLSLFVSTFNMGEQNVLASELAAWLPLGYEIYVIGVQECMDLADLQTKIHHHLVVGSQCKFVYYSREIGKRATALGYHGYIALTVFVREAAVLDGRFAMPPRARANKAAQEVYRGKSLLLFGRASNKGAVGMSFRFEQTSFAFATCHLASDSSSTARRSKRNKSRDGVGSANSNSATFAGGQYTSNGISGAGPATSTSTGSNGAAAPPSKLERRNRDAMQILQQLYLDDEDYGFGFPLLHHHSFVLGDFNYRMTRRNASPHEMLANLTRVGAEVAATIDVVPLPSSPPSVLSSDETDSSPTNSSFGFGAYSFASCVTPTIGHRPLSVPALVAEHDELRSLLDSNELFFGFCEPPITFFPTFRRVRGKQLDPSDAASFAANYTLVTAKGGYRVPSFTDRVLHSSLPGSHDLVECIAYTSCESVTTSDHKPVCGAFNVTLNDPLPVGTTPTTTGNSSLSPSPSLGPDDAVWTNSGGANLNVLTSVAAAAAHASRMRDVPGACEMQLKIDFRSVHWMDAIDAQPGAATLFDRVDDIEFGFLFPIPCEDVFSQQRKLHEVAEFLTWMDSGGGGVSSSGAGSNGISSGTSGSGNNGYGYGYDYNSGADFAATVTPTSNFHTIKWNHFVEGGLRYTTTAQPSSKKHVAVLIRAQSRARGLSRTASASTTSTSSSAFGANGHNGTAAAAGAGTESTPTSARALKTTPGAGTVLGQGTFCVDASGRKTDASISLTVGGRLLGRLQLRVALQVRRPRAASGGSGARV